MNRITKWIQERRAYSNPVFGAMLIVSATIFPVFQASARIAEPVQPMALNAEDVVDALGAVEAGATVEQAFLEQPLPYRDFISTWSFAYQELFGAAIPSGGDAYLLDEEISLGDTGFFFEGNTENGQVFNIEFVAIIEADINSESIPAEERLALNSVSANPFGVIGTFSTNTGTIHFAGVLAQWGNDEERVREIVILDIISQEFLDDYSRLSANFLEEPGNPDEVDPCTSCTQSAHNAARLRMDLAIIALNAALAGAALWMVGKGILCAATSAILVIGMMGAASCMFRAALQASATVFVATTAFNSARLGSNALLRAALEDCYINNPGCRPV